jgi:hypothetical protein
LQIATYSATPAALVAPAAAPGVVVGVDVVPVLACVLAVDAVVAAVVAAGVDVLALLGVELPPLLPHPATSAAESSATTSNGDRLPIIGPP